MHPIIDHSRLSTEALRFGPFESSMVPMSQSRIGPLQDVSTSTRRSIQWHLSYVSQLPTKYVE